MAIPAILKGDTSGNIVLDILAGYEYTGCTLAVVFNGVRKEFTDLVAGGTKSLQYTADETAGMPLGTAHATLTLTNPAGVVRSMPWVRIRVTDIPSEIYDRHITVDPSQLDVPDATAGDSLAQVKAKLNAVMAFLRGGAACLVACLGLSAFGDLCPTNTLNDVPGDTTISNLVVASGVATGGGGITANDATNAAAAVVVRDVPSWARQANPPESMTDNALVLTNGAVKTKDGSSTVTAAQVGAYSKVNNAGNGNVPVFGSNGTLVDSGIDYQRLYYRPNAFDGGKLLMFDMTGALVESDISDGEVLKFQQGITLTGDNTWPHIDLNPFGTDKPSVSLGLLELYFVDGLGYSTEYAANQIVHKGHTFTFPNWNGRFALADEIPNVPAWALAASKPTYTAAEVGARPNNWMPTAADVGARPNNWMPTAAEVGAISTTQLTNAALQVANQTWDEGYQILWRKVANNGGFYEVCVTNVDLTAGGAQ